MNMQSICMFTPVGSSYNKDFPPLEKFTEKEFRHIPKIPTQLHGEKVSAAEATLNWQTENALAQNATLQRIDARVTQMDTKITMVEIKVDSNTKIANELIVALHRMLREVEKRPAKPGQDLLYHIEQKTQEIQRLKDHIKSLEDHGLPSSACQGETLFPSLSRTTPTSVFSPFTRRELPPTPNVQLSYYRTKKDEGSQHQNPLTSFLKSYKEATIPKIAVVQADDHVQSSSESGSSEDSQSSSE
ncbi:hypothetical protein V6N12_006954 [Hibiscus sabdariffa]|uniref:Uncharacterized protein n=1 Tax=Hibiscus sabdariffa TaxID=183260 RepID=A0ABR2F0B2_9ROSI